MSFVIENRHNIKYSTLFRSNMKEIDDTPLPETESEDPGPTTRRMMVVLNDQIQALTLRVANLETQRTPQDENDDPEWYS